MAGNDLYIGLMSGTSLDGVDAALVRVNKTGCRHVGGVFRPFDAELRSELLALNHPGDNEIARGALAGNILARRYAEAVDQLLGDAKIKPPEIVAIGCHGQTVRHRPDLGFSIQLGNPSLLAELTGIQVAADFRSRDIAAGGQGAPLVPAFHAAVFSHPQRSRVIVNIGGISNLTWLASTGTVIGFDCGPGNLLLDGWTQAHLGTPFDRDGAWAASGRVDPNLLAALLAHPFFTRQPPKSTGRDDFHLDWLRSVASSHHAPADVQASLLELTARGIADAIGQHCPGAQEVYLCGGGAHNLALRARLRDLLPQRAVDLTDALGIAADWVEATAFAWLAHRTCRHMTGNLPEVTGARGTRVLGALYAA